MGDDKIDCYLFVGKLFANYEELVSFISAYELEHNQKYWIRSSRTVKTAKKFLKRPLCSTIRYYELQYSCIHGGLEFRTRSKGLRHKRTFKSDCPAHIKIRATMDGNKLEVKSFDEEHEHDELRFGFMLNKSRLDETQLDSPPSKKHKPEVESSESEDDEEDYVEDEEGRVLIKKQILPILESLKEKVGATGINFYNNSDHLIGIYLTTKIMEKSLVAYQDVLYIWAIPGWIKEDFGVILISIKDSNGDSEIVGIGLIKNEDKSALNWFFKTIKDEFSRLKLEIKYIFGEKHIVDTHLKQLIPKAEAFVSLHSSLRLFQRILDSEAFVVTKKEPCLEYFRRMVYSKSLEDYKSAYSNFCKAAPQSMVDYFDEDWGSNTHDWTLFSMVNGGTLIDESSKMEPIDGKIQYIIPKGLSLLFFIKNLFKWINVQKVEHKFKASTYILKKPTNIAIQSCVEKYASYLTSYAFSFVNHQINMCRNVTILEKIDDMSITQENNVLNPATSNSCECKDWRSMLLPCRHIFAVRKANKENFFSDTLCNKRWTKKYYIENRLPPDEIERIQKEKESKPDSETHKLTERSTHAITITDKILNVLCTYTGDELEKKIKILEEIESHWASGVNFKIVPLPSIAEPEVIHNKPEKVVVKKVPRIETSPNRIVRNTEEWSRTKLGKNPQMTSKIIKIDLSHYGKANLPLKFGLKPKHEQIKMILSWISNRKDTIYDDSYTLDIYDIEMDPKSIQHSVLNEAVNLELIKPRLSPEAYKTLIEVINEKRENEFWLCFICEAQLEDNCVLCASCLLWFHPKCVGIANPQKRKVWFCFNCVKSCNPGKS